MTKKYHDLWISRNGSSPLQGDNLTISGAEWSDQLTGLKRSEIENGFKALPTSKWIEYPPNAMSFRKLCTGDTEELVLKCILARIREGDSYQWTDKMAFNLWVNYSYDFLNSRDQRATIKLVEQNLKFLDQKTIIDLPDYSAPALEVVIVKTKAVRSKFLAEMKKNC